MYFNERYMATKRMHQSNHILKSSMSIRIYCIPKASKNQMAARCYIPDTINSSMLS